MFQVLLILHVVIAIFLVLFILLQQGKGALTGAAFGSGASTTVFGSQGSGNFLTRTTATLATLFFITSLSLTYLANIKSHHGMSEGVPIPIQTKEKLAPKGQAEQNKATSESTSIPEVSH